VFFLFIERKCPKIERTIGVVELIKTQEILDASLHHQIRYTYEKTESKESLENPQNPILRKDPF